jgi:signal transduction histidine kinase/ActR/RegA family two-component response regulator
MPSLGTPVFDNTPVSLATTTPSSLHRILVVLIGGLLVLVTVVLWPHAGDPGPELPGFVAVYGTAVAICDLLTAMLLLSQFAQIRTATLLILSCGYLFTALIVMIHLSSFPGAFTTAYILGGDSDTTPWLWNFWHSVFPITVLLSAVVRRPVRTNPHRAVAVAILLTGGAIVAATVFSARYNHALPPMIQDRAFTPFYLSVVYPVLTALCLAALAALLFRRKEHSVLTLYLTLTVLAFSLDVVNNWHSGARYAVGWYLGRANGFVASVLLCLVFVVENAALLRYADRAAARLAEFNVALRATNADLERRVEERSAQLVQTQKMEAIGQLTSGVAHDFNNVLQGIGGCVSALENRIPDEEARRLFDAVQQGIERGGRLTQHMLAFARRQALAPEPTGLDALFDRMRPILERSMGGLIQIGLDVAPDTWPGLVDPVQLELAILNLAINARDAMPAGGRLTLRTANVTVTTLVDSTRPADLKPGDYVMVSVEDTGTGMDAATLARVFDPFFTTKDIGKGSGLGLSMVYGMTAQSGGGIAITSTVDQGTTVSLYLPRAMPVASEQSRPFVEVVRGGQQVVLLVDDDALVRLGAEAVLTRLGYRVLAANSGDAALTLLRAGAAVDALVTDYAMPGMNGATLVQEIRRLAPGLPALLITGYADTPTGLQYISLLQKPFRPNDLAAHLATLLCDSRPKNVVPITSSRKG